jgi:glycerate 2-kinase
MEISRAVEDTVSIFAGALTRVDPATLVADAVQATDNAILVEGIPYALRPGSRLIVIGIGKAAASMALGVEEALGDRIDGGVVVIKRGTLSSDARPSRIQVVEASHPVPDETSMSAARRILEAVHDLCADDLVLALISGGGSALVELPAAELSISDLAVTTDILLRAGADIRVLNAVRRRLSKTKAGGLARAAAPARIINLVISDVLGNPLDVIASGPTVEVLPEGTAAETLVRCLGVGVWAQLPERVRAVLEKPEADLPIAGHNVVRSIILADAGLAAEVAGDAARENGYTPIILGTHFEGEAREFGRFWSVVVLQMREGLGTFRPPLCLIGAGELTVTVKGNGIGGRNTEMALSAALEIEGVPGVAVASLATDGDDAGTGTAGGVVVGGSVELARRTGLDPVALLANNDSLRFLDATAGVVVTGPTGTNVNDLYLGLIP